jgi:hypothetical protein
VSRPAAVGAAVGLAALFLLAVLVSIVGEARPATERVEWEETTTTWTVRPIRDVPQDPMPEVEG